MPPARTKEKSKRRGKRSGRKGLLSLSATARKSVAGSMTMETGSETYTTGHPGFRALRYRCKHTYYTNLSLTTAAGVASNYVFSANGLYDPDVTGTGHIAMAFNQMSLSFYHYVVVASRMTVTFRNLSATYPITCALHINGSNTPSTDWTQLCESGSIMRRFVDVAGTSNSICTMSIPCNIAKFEGVKSLMDAREYAGSLTSNPVEQTYYCISAWNSYNGTACPFTAEVFIEYDAWWIEPRALSLSTMTAVGRLLVAEARQECKT